MEKIIINKRNNKKAYEAFQSGTLAFAETANKRFGVISYDDPATTDKGEKWSECAFGNMLIDLFNGRYKEIYIIKPLNIFGEYQEMINAVKENALYIITREEIKEAIQ